MVKETALSSLDWSVRDLPRNYVARITDGQLEGFGVGGGGGGGGYWNPSVSRLLDFHGTVSEK